MNYIALDLDGTLLNSQREISQITKDYLIDVQEAGHKIILCSGRSYLGMKPIAEILEIAKYDGYLVSYNGGVGIDVKSGTELFGNRFDVNQVKTLYDLVSSYAENFVSYGEGTINSNVINDRIKISSELMQAKITKDIFVPSPKVVLQDEVEIIEEIYPKIKEIIREYNSEYNVFRSVPHLIEITPPNSDKATGLKHLFSIKELSGKLIAFGDGENDLSMLEYADISVAMDNAMANVKAIADFVTLSNDENGIVHQLEQILQGE